MIAFPFFFWYLSLFSKCFTTDMTCIYCNHKVLLTSPWGHEGQTASVQEGHEDSDPGSPVSSDPLESITCLTDVGGPFYPRPSATPTGGAYGPGFGWGVGRAEG